MTYGTCPPFGDCLLPILLSKKLPNVLGGVKRHTVVHLPATAVIAAVQPELRVDGEMLDATRRFLQLTAVGPVEDLLDRLLVHLGKSHPYSDAYIVVRAALLAMVVVSAAHRCRPSPFPFILLSGHDYYSEGKPSRVPCEVLTGGFS